MWRHPVLQSFIALWLVNPIFIVLRRPKDVIRGAQSNFAGVLFLLVCRSAGRQLLAKINLFDDSRRRSPQWSGDVGRVERAHSDRRGETSGVKFGSEQSPKPNMPGSNRVYHTPAEWAKNSTQFRVLTSRETTSSTRSTSPAMMWNKSPDNQRSGKKALRRSYSELPFCEGTQCYNNRSVRLPFKGTILTKKEEKTLMIQKTYDLPPNRTGFHNIQDSFTTESDVDAPRATDLDSTDI
ncbi:hypothetical protein B0H14DRAFT_3776757 [Mycena olivaceomarginata]|nr:hypothetical protein B0H14DRAFT_3776757 [Mycena olivaceomarginata]